MGLMQSTPRQQIGFRERVAIVGYGNEGQAILNYLRSSGDYDITIIDEAEEPKNRVPDGVNALLGPGVLDNSLDYDTIWRASPAISPARIKTSGQIVSMSTHFFSKCSATIIGVTGTKGKGTTSTLISKILEVSGQKNHLLGNIGTPALDVLDKVKPEDVVVFELSSFQLWDMRQSPHIAVVLMVEPEHLDVHTDLNDYVQAKSNISRWQTDKDAVIYHPTNKLSEKIAQTGLGRKLKYLTTDGAYIENEMLKISGQDICSISEFGLIGKHNHENIAAAVTAAWQITQDTKAMAKAIREFKGLEHRLQVIAEKEGIKYVNDSFSTTPSSAMAAIEAFTEPKILILGGSDKGVEYDDLAKKVASGGVKKAVLIGQMADKIADALKKAGFNSYEKIDGTMPEIISAAKSSAKPGDVILLSPACASFDMFKSYIDRAQQFVEAVNKL